MILLNRRGPFVVASKCLGQDLDHDVPIELRVAPPTRHTDPARAEGGEDLYWSKGVCQGDGQFLGIIRVNLAVQADMSCLTPSRLAMPRRTCGVSIMSPHGRQH